MSCQNLTEWLDTQLVSRKLGNWFLVLEGHYRMTLFGKKGSNKMRVGSESNTDLCSYKKGDIWTHTKTHRDNTM